MNEPGVDLVNRIKARACELGFDLCGIAPAIPSAFKAEFRKWIANGFHGEMGYMARNSDRRLDPSQLLPGAKSIVVVGMNYYTESDADTSDPERAVFARYARGDDYHDVMTPRLRDLLGFIKEVCPVVPNDVTTQRSQSRYRFEGLGRPNDPTTEREDEDEDENDSPTPTEGKVYVDTGPVLEREVARLAGLGWFGKNTMLINTRHGSYFLLGEIILNLPLPPDSPAEGSCGTCRACIDACPTLAIVEPFKLDARRCISYLTIELKGPIPEEFHGKIGNRVFGCDICQEVCPFNVRRAAPTQELAFHPREITNSPKLTELLDMTEEEFRGKFKGSPVKRAKWRGLMRDVAAALAVSDHPAAEAALLGALDHPVELVRQQAAIALDALRARKQTRTFAP
jgi:epoxyqueuosine reductase